MTEQPDRSLRGWTPQQHIDEACRLVMQYDYETALLKAEVHCAIARAKHEVHSVNEPETTEYLCKHDGTDILVTVWPDGRASVAFRGPEARSYGPQRPMHKQ